MRVGELATRFAVSVSYVSKVLGRRRLTGETAARPQRHQLEPKLAGLHETIGAEVARRPDATLLELRGWLLKTHEMSASTALMWTTLGRLGLTLEKRPSTRRSRIGPTLPKRGGNSERPSLP